MTDLYTSLRDFADDSRLEVIAYDSDQLRFRVVIDSHGGRRYSLLIPKPIHLDMPPYVMLGKIEFGDWSLLPTDYMGTRYRGYEGDEESWRVMRVTDDEENCYFAVYTESETIMPEE